MSELYPVIWRKEWRNGVSTKPLGERSAELGPRLSEKFAREEYRAALSSVGADHPRTRAAHGRLLFYQGCVPQRDLITIEAIAWLRESGAIFGYMNRGERRAKESRSRHGDVKLRLHCQGSRPQGIRPRGRLPTGDHSASITALSDDRDSRSLG